MLPIRTVIDFPGNIPKYYELFLGPLLFEPFALDMADQVNKLGVSTILELACGTGKLTQLLPTVVTKDASIIASDINPGMLNYAQTKVMDKRIKWLEVDAVRLPFDDEMFDCVVVQFGVMYYSDRVQAFKEALRVLKPGGIFLFNCWDELKHNPIFEITNRTLQQFFPINTPNFYTAPCSYADEKMIVSDLMVSGFSNIKIVLKKLIGHSELAIQAAKGLIQGGPTVLEIERRDLGKLPFIVDHLENELSKQFGAFFLRVPLQARVVTAIKN